MSDFWLQKMRTYFKRIDFDGDGKITRKDFEAMATRFADSGKLQKDHSDDLFKTLTAVWDDFLHTAGSEGLDQDAFIAAMKKWVNDPKLKTTLEGPLPLFFKAVDADNDGNISGEEYEIFFKILGLDPKLATDSFKAIDTNNDGALSAEEFKTAGSDFFLSEDKSSPTRFFWGPLVD